MRKFSTGATRGNEENKFDYEGFIDPFVLERYGEYMHGHRTQADGNHRASDNWQKGMSKDSYKKSLLRHTFDVWRTWREGTVIDPETRETISSQSLLCAIMFNVMGLLHEELKDQRHES